MYKKILVAFDESEMASRALQHAAELAKTTDCEKLTIIHVAVQSPIVQEYLGSVDLLTLLDKENAKLLSKVVDYMKSENIPYDTESFSGFDAGQIIANYATDNQYDLVVMGRTGKGFVQEALIGSVSIKVLRSAKCPVLIIK